VRIAFIGNCQVESLAVSAKHMLDDAEISMFDYSQHYSRDEEERRRYVLGLHSTDYVFAQTATFSHTSEHDLREVLGDRLVTIANFYFRGLFPDTCYIGDFHGRLDTPSTLHSAIVVDGFRRGLSEEEVCARFDGETLDALGLGEAWESSVAEMRAREANGVLDVPVGALMEEACRRYPAFLTMNHPSGRLMTEYFSKVLDHLGLPHRLPAEDSYPDALARHDMVPIHDFVAERLGLAYRTRQDWKVNSLGGATSREDYVAACFQAYAQHDPQSLLIHSPTDMVASLRHSAYRYLVERDGAEAVRNPRLPDSARRSRERRLSGTLADAMQPLETAVAEVSEAVRTGQALAGIDPKLLDLAERLRRMEEAARRAEAEAAASRADRETARRNAEREMAARLAEAAACHAQAAVADRKDILADIGRLRQHVDGLYRLVRLALGLTTLAVLIALGRLVLGR
jgi:hypothetical protein